MTEVLPQPLGPTTQAFPNLVKALMTADTILVKFEENTSRLL